MGRLFDALTIDHEKLARDRDRVTRGMLGAGTGAIRETTKALERRLEARTKEAVPGKLWRAWKSNAFPKTGIAQKPAGTVFLNGRDRTQGAFEFFTRPGRIKGKSGQFLAIPTPAAGARGRMRNLTPGEWERRTGVRLRFVYRRGRPSLLVADGGAFSAKGAYRPLTRARKAADVRRGFVRNEATVVIFVLVPQVPFANRFAIEPLVNASEGELAREFFSRVRAVA